MKHNNCTSTGCFVSFVQKERVYLMPLRFESQGRKLACGHFLTFTLLGLFEFFFKMCNGT